MSKKWDDLEELYIDRGMSASQIALIKGVNEQTVKNALSNYKLRKELEKGKDVRKCFSCGICIGLGYIEGFSFKVGDKILCGWCYKNLKDRGFLQINSFFRLLPTGEVITKRICWWKSS